MRIKAKLAAIALGATAARADGWDRGCDARIRKEQRDLQRAINRHGYFSRQAQSERAELRRAQESCRGYGWFRRDGDRDRDDWGRKHHRDRDRDRDGYRDRD